jgi:hypothetical protein
VAATGRAALALLLPVRWMLRGLPSALRRPPPSPRRGRRATRPLVLCYGVMGFGYILPATFLPVLARTWSTIRAVRPGLAGVRRDRRRLHLIAPAGSGAARAAGLVRCHG